MSNLIDNLFESIEFEIELRIHSLETQLDLLVDLTTTNAFFNNTDKIILRNKRITKDNVGHLKQYKIFRKVKSTSFVYCKHTDDYTQQFIRRQNLELYFSTIPTLVHDTENYISGIVRNNVLFTVSYDYDIFGKIFSIYYSQTNVTKFILDWTSPKPVRFEIDDNNIYFFTDYELKFILDFWGNDNMNFVPIVRDTTELTGSTHMFKFSDYKIIYGLHFTELYAIVRARDAIFFFHKKTLLYSHKVDGDYCNNDGFTFIGNIVDGYTFLGNKVDGANCFVKISGTRYYHIISLDGVEEKNSFGCNIMENMEEKCCNNDIKKEYDVCGVEPNCIWYCLRYPYEYPTDYNLIKVEF